VNDLLQRIDLPAFERSAMLQPTTGREPAGLAIGI
jgi:hypothetical protein